MTVATSSFSSLQNKSDSQTRTRKLSQSSSSLAQLHTLSKRLRLLSEEPNSKRSNNNNNNMASAAPHSRSNSNSSSTRPKPALTIDISSLPPLSRPTPPSNTLIITELHNLLIFQPPSLTAVREQITSVAPLNSFSPLPSFRRIVCSFLSIENAIKVRQNLEFTKTIFNEYGLRARIYFGETTPIETEEQAKRGKLLEAPQSQKLFFISPPPSPPHGWVMRNEEPPNKEVHASDLADALSRLGTNSTQSTSDVSSYPLSPVSGPSSPSDSHNNNNNNNNKETTIPGVTRTGSWPPSSTSAGAGGRSRSSTLIFHPNDHGGSPNLPAVMVEDTSVGEYGDFEDDMMNLESDGEQKKIFAHTARPPVELMH